MKKFVSLAFFFVAFTAASAASVWAKNPAQRLDLRYLTDSDSNQTPYQKIEDLFQHAAPMPLDQFIEGSDPAIKNLNCVNASEHTTIDQLVEDKMIPARVTGKIVADPATPDRGPLFPGSQKKDQILHFVYFVPNDGSYQETEEQQKVLGHFFQDYHLKLTKTPGVIVRLSLEDDTDPKANYDIVWEFRTMQGLIVYKWTVKTTAQGDGSADQPKIIAATFYGYCWQR